MNVQYQTKFHFQPALFFPFSSVHSFITLWCTSCTLHVHHESSMHIRFSLSQTHTSRHFYARLQALQHAGTFDASFGLWEVIAHLCRKPSHINLAQCKPQHTYPLIPPCHHILQTCICLCESPRIIFLPWKPSHIALGSVNHDTHLHQCISAALHAQHTYMILIVSNN